MSEEGKELYDGDNFIDDLELNEDEKFILKQIEDKKEKEEKEKELLREKRQEKKKDKVKSFMQQQIEKHRAAVSELEKSDGLIIWEFDDSKLREMLTGKIDDQILFEISKGITVWTLRVVDKDLQKIYKEETRHSSHSAFTYQQLKEKADKIIDSFWQKDS